MSATKDHAIKKANAAKEPLPPASRRNKIKKAVAETGIETQRVFTKEQVDALVNEAVVKAIQAQAEEAEARAHMREMSAIPAIEAFTKTTIEPEPVLPDSSQHGEAVSPTITIEQGPETITEPSPTIKQKLAALWVKEKWVIIFVVVALATGLIIGLICNQIRLAKINRQLRETQKVESKLNDQKADLGVTEGHLAQMLKMKSDSAMDEASQLASKAVEYQRAWEVSMKRAIQLQKEQHEIFEAKVMSASDDSLRWAGGDRSGRK